MNVNIPNLRTKLAASQTESLKQEKLELHEQVDIDIIKSDAVRVNETIKISSEMSTEDYLYQEAYVKGLLLNDMR